ncbi:hypothetical protein AB3X26_17285 [Raoultella planticola]|uniref:hypothetical protein n=1 Tax=Raoultella planticola TaxID=575 RepID=UPI00349F53A6
MKLVCDGVISAKGLELSEPVMLLNDSASLGTYGLQDALDLSGNGNDLKTDNEFTNSGMTVVEDTAHTVDTGIIDTDEFSFVICLNVSKPTTTLGGIIFSNLIPDVPPYSGLQLRINSDGSLWLQVANAAPSGPSDPTFQFYAGNAAGGWTRFSGVISNSQKLMTLTRAGGQTYSIPMPTRAKGTRPIRLNGSLSTTKSMGLKGVMGCVAFYDRALTLEEQSQMRDYVKDYIMPDRGISIS